MKTIKVFRELSHHARLFPVSFLAEGIRGAAVPKAKPPGCPGSPWILDGADPSQKITESPWLKSTAQLVKNDQFDDYAL